VDMDLISLKVTRFDLKPSHHC